MADLIHEVGWVLKGRITLPSAWKGRTRARKKSGKATEATWKRNKAQAGPVRRLTSQWSGRLRAARYGAAHRRVRRHLQKRFVDFSHNQFAIGCAPVEEANVLRY